VGFKFNPEVEEAKGEIAGRVTNILSETREAIRARIIRSFREGGKKFEVFRDLEDVVGLSSPAAKAVSNYRQSLIDAEWDDAAIDKAVDRYSNRKIRERAETIARTETMTILNAGVELAWDQGMDQGYFDGIDMERVWIVTPDERLCPICEPMTNVSVPYGEDFPIDGPPAHPRCRCTEGLREVR
jgi:hypothetical protein